MIENGESIEKKNGREKILKKYSKTSSYLIYPITILYWFS